MSKTNLRKNVLKIVLISLVLFAFFVPQHTNADLIDISSSVFDTGVAWANARVLEGMGNIISWSALMLEQFIKPDVQEYILNYSVVEESWTIIRNFVNMFFILFLIIIAFGTIFGIEKYYWRNTIMPFLAAALLVNFSLAIGKFVIQIGNSLAAMVLVWIQQSGANISTNLGSGLGLGSYFKDPGIGALASIAGGGAQTLVTLVFSAVFLTITLFALLSALIFAIARIPVLWAILILSPIAFVSYALPSLQHIWKKWWSYLISWSFFLPTYLFFLMFSIFFISQKGKVGTPQPTGIAEALVGPGSAVGDLLFFILTILFLVGGLLASFKVGSLAGSGVNKTFSAIQGGIKRGTRRITGYDTAAAGVREGLQGRIDEISEKGLAGIGGAQRARISQAKWAESFGFGTKRGAADEARQKEIEKEFSKLKTLNLDKTGLEQRLSSTKGIDKMAALRLKAEQGWLNTKDLDQIKEAIQSLGGGKTIAGVSFINSLKKGGFKDITKSTVEKEALFNSLSGPEFIELQKALGSDMAKKKEIIKPEMAKKVIGLYENDSAEAKKEIMDAIKNNLGNIYADKGAREKFLVDTTDASNTELRRLLAEKMVEDDEIDSYKKYHAAQELFSGDPQKITDMRNKIAKENPIVAAEVETRSNMSATKPGIINPDYVLEEADQKAIADTDTIKKAVGKASAKQLGQSNKDTWKEDWFKIALWKKADSLQKVDPHKSAAGKRRRIPGGGERFLQSLKKSVGENTDKIPVLNELLQSFDESTGAFNPLPPTP
ncbi:MAG: MFS transporter [Candidatus Paceibacterota bacterium]